jgi:hypothetical protein
MGEMNMKKSISLLILVLLVTSVLAACTSGNAGTKDKENVGQEKPSTAAEQPKKEAGASEELLQMFPSRVGTEWIYNGFAEYGHQMRLDAVNIMNSSTLQYLITGEVADMSGGAEGTGDYSLLLEYRFTAQAVREVFVKGEKVPHKIKEFDILRLPLEKGNTWTQKVVITGKETELKAEIMEAGKDPASGAKVVKVDYTAPMEGFPGGQYKESRTFREKEGLLHFVNTYDETIEFNYGLHSVK